MQTTKHWLDDMVVALVIACCWAQIMQYCKPLYNFLSLLMWDSYVIRDSYIIDKNANKNLQSSSLNFHPPNFPTIRHFRKMCSYCLLQKKIEQDMLPVLVIYQGIHNLLVFFPLLCYEHLQHIYTDGRSLSGSRRKTIFSSTDPSQFATNLTTDNDTIDTLRQQVVELKNEVWIKMFMS